VKLSTGVDILEVSRMTAAAERHGGRLLKRVFTSAELEACQGRPESLAVRFAAKEAAAKALGHGFGEISWQDIEILNDDRKAPFLVLHGEALRIAQEKRLTTWSVSLSHERQYAVAFVVAMG
jgi:holo-[acyl-carrier-protein] synthase